MHSENKQLVRKFLAQLEKLKLKVNRANAIPFMYQFGSE